MGPRTAPATDGEDDDEKTANWSGALEEEGTMMGLLLLLRLRPAGAAAPSTLRIEVG